MIRQTGRYERNTVAGEEATAMVRRLHGIVSVCRERVLVREKATVFSLKLFELLAEHPVVTVNRVVEMLDCSWPAAGKALRIPETALALRPLDDRKKNWALVFGEYLDELRQGAELS